MLYYLPMCNRNNRLNVSNHSCLLSVTTDVDTSGLDYLQIQVGKGKVPKQLPRLRHSEN